MLFLSYWELNPDFDPSELAEIAQMILNKKLFPVEGTKMISWYMSTSDFWGISITEAENEEQMAKGTQVWRIAKPGLFKFIKTTPAMETAKVLPLLIKLKKELKG